MPTYTNTFAINGVIDTSKTVLQNLQEICLASGCWLVYNIADGKWDVVINTTGSSIKSFNISNIIGNVDLLTTSLTEYYNEVEIEFPHKDILDQRDFENYSIPSTDLLPNERTNRLTIQSNLINNPIQAQLIAARDLKQSRVDKVIQFTTDYSSLGLKAGDLINVTLAQYSFNSKVFRITSIEETDDDDGSLLLRITALEYNGNVYSTSGLVYRERLTDNGIRTAAANSSLVNIDNKDNLKIDLTATGRVSGLGLAFNSATGRYDLTLNGTLQKIQADHAVITWTYKDGIDLDIRCRIYSPSIQSGVDNYLGWTGATSTTYWPSGSDLTTAIISWGGDNTGPGGDANAQETVYVNVSRFKSLYANNQYLVIECRGNWFAALGTQTVRLDATIYKGGTVARSGFNFTVSNATETATIDGVELYVTSFAGNGTGGTPPGGDTTIGDFMGYLIIDVINNTAQFRNDIIRLP